MSEYNDKTLFDSSERRLDLLVDGELNEADRRDLLLQLEHEPEGWRRCALAFLEAQSWKAELGPIARSPSAEPVTAPPAVRPAVAEQPQRWRQYLATILTMAASFLIALAVGMGLRGNWPGGSSHSSDSSLVRSAINEVPLPHRDVSPLPAAGTAVLAMPASAQAASGQSVNDWETVTLVGAKSSDGPTETVNVLAQRRDTLDQNMLDRVPDALPPELQQAYEQSGHRIVQQREIVPVQMKDGRRLVVPVDHIQIHYVGRPSL